MLGMTGRHHRELLAHKVQHASDIELKKVKAFHEERCRMEIKEQDGPIS
jgi:hypothetical protein